MASRKTSRKATAKVSWKRELRNLVNTAQNEQERSALMAFEASVGPYLANPMLLRTVLSKIQASLEAGAVAILTSQADFDSVDDVQKALPRNVKVVKL